MRRSALLVLLVVLMNACSLLPSGGRLDGTWQLVAGTVRGETIEPVAGAPLTLTVDGAEVSGSAGCNSFGGEVTVDGDSLRFGDLFQTLMGCDEALARAESMFMEGLRATERGRRDGNRLTLSGEASELSFELVEGPA